MDNANVLEMVMTYYRTPRTKETNGLVKL